ncbi:MAG TPA: DUF2330 domain-containing protein [Verrucomicrobiae bacterium]|nr:DUF2330 domain-containing protein [Verrucomicrobiae bacterium]
MKRPVRVYLKGGLALLLGLLLFSPTLALACAVAINGSGSGLDYAMPTNAQGLISFENGIEKMVMSHEIKASNKGVVVIAPIPASPSDVKLDTLADMPQFHGTNIAIAARKNIKPVRELSQLSQIWPIVPFTMLRLVSSTGSVAIESSESGTPSLSASQSKSLGTKSEPEVVVFNTLTKEGITSEVLTAKTSQALYTYLKGKGLTIEEGSITALSSYIGKDFSFVVSWVTGTGETLPSTGSQKGIFVSFPTKEMYYPLIPTSAYSDHSHGEVIRVMGHVSPKLYRGIKKYAKVTYYRESSPSYSAGLSPFFATYENTPVDYTDIELSAPAKAYTQDLAISSRTPFKARYISFIGDYPLAYGILFLLVSSIVTSLLVGLAIFADRRTWAGAFTFMKVGACNILTVIGLVIAARHVWPTDRRRRAFILFFTFAFLVITALLSRVVELTLQ